MEQKWSNCFLKMVYTILRVNENHSVSLFPLYFYSVSVDVPIFGCFVFLEFFQVTCSNNSLFLINSMFSSPLVSFLPFIITSNVHLHLRPGYKIKRVWALESDRLGFRSQLSYLLDAWATSVHIFLCLKGLFIHLDLFLHNKIK